MDDKWLYNSQHNMSLLDPFPSFEFDEWAQTYDRSITSDRFPFQGYENLLDMIVALANAKPGMSVLDLGAGTGNLALCFAALGCDLWCSDFSPSMLEKARQKLPTAHFVLHDLRSGWPLEIDRSFDRIVSAYVFHHFELEEKVRIIHSLVKDRLVPDGQLIIGDIAFQNAAAQENMKIFTGDQWEDEFYWLANKSLAALANANLRVEYTQVSVCAGVFNIRNGG
jgi:putative AdoMet-dependent methyltransferase